MQRYEKKQYNVKKTTILLRHLSDKKRKTVGHESDMLRRKPAFGGGENKGTKKAGIACQPFQYPGRDLNPHALASNRF